MKHGPGHRAKPVSKGAQPGLRRDVVLAVQQLVCAHLAGIVRRRRAWSHGVRAAAQHRPPYRAAAREQREGPEPQHPRDGLYRWFVEHEITVTCDEVGFDLPVALARERERAHLAPEIVGQIGIGIGEGLILAYEAAELRFEPLEPHVERAHPGRGFTAWR